jgi:hypothetical protein
MAPCGKNIEEFALHGATCDAVNPVSMHFTEPQVAHFYKSPERAGAAGRAGMMDGGVATVAGAAGDMPATDRNCRCGQL